MVTRYVKSGATGAADGTTWADAYTTLAAVAGVDTAGDIIYVSDNHSESTAGAVTLDWAGTAADPTRVICADDSTGEPPTTVATGAVVATTGANALTVASSNDVVYFYGIRFKAGDSTNSADIAMGSAEVVFDKCAFELGGNNSGSDITGAGRYTFIGCTFKSSNTGSVIQLGAAGRMYGCSIESGGTPGNPFFEFTGSQECRVVGFDFSNLNTTYNICSNTSVAVQLSLINCKMAGSWSGSINSSTPGSLSVFELTNSDSADTNYRLQRKTQFGEVVHETTIKRTGGASDGTTGLSWKMVSTADAEWNHQTLDSPEIVRWNERTGASVTATIEIVHDSVTNLTDKEVWIDVSYLGTSGFPLGSTVSDSAANYLSSGADQTASTETWTTTGLTNPNKQKLSVTFTPQEVGAIRCVVKLAAASKTVYVDPKLNVTY